MSIWKKCLFILSALLLGTFAFALFTQYQYAGSFNFNLLKPEEYSFVGEYVPRYFYWGSFLLLLLLLALILMIIVIPKKQTEIMLSEGKGILKIHSNAIVGLVKQKAQQSKILQGTKVKVRMSKKKIKIHIAGSVVESTETVETINRLTKEIEQYIQSFIGLAVPVKVEVLFKNTAQADVHSKKRVV